MLRLVILSVLLAAYTAVAEICPVDTGSPFGDCSCECDCEVECPARAACTVGVGSSGEVRSYDGHVDYMVSANKYLITSHAPGSNTQCSFRVRVDSDDDGNGGIEVAFTGTGFGVHHGMPTNGDYERNYRIFKNNKDGEIRGRGFSSPQPVPTDACYHSEGYPLFWTFCISYPDTVNHDVVVVHGSVPQLGCWYTVTTMKVGALGNPYPHEIVTVEASPWYDNKLIGMCGNRDGIPDNDDQFCLPHPTETDHLCIDGEHQFNQG